MKEYLKSRTHDELVHTLHNIYKALDSFYPDLLPQEELKIKLDLIGVEFPFGAYITTEMDNALLSAKSRYCGLNNADFLNAQRDMGNIDEYGRPTDRGVETGAFNRKQDQVVLIAMGSVYNTYRLRYNGSFIIIHRDENQGKKVGLDSLATWLGFPDGKIMMETDKMQTTIKEIENNTGLYPLKSEAINGVFDNYFDLSLWVETFGEFNPELWSLAY